MHQEQQSIHPHSLKNVTTSIGLECPMARPVPTSHLCAAGLSRLHGRNSATSLRTNQLILFVTTTYKWWLALE